MHLEDAADSVDCHPNQILALVVCGKEGRVRRVTVRGKRRRRTALIKHLDQRPQPLTADKHLKSEEGGAAHRPDEERRFEANLARVALGREGHDDGAAADELSRS